MQNREMEGITVDMYMCQNCIKMRSKERSDSRQNKIHVLIAVVVSSMLFLWLIYSQAELNNRLAKAEDAIRDLRRRELQIELNSKYAKTDDLHNQRYRNSDVKDEHAIVESVQPSDEIKDSMLSNDNSTTILKLQHFSSNEQLKRFKRQAEAGKKMKNTRKVRNGKKENNKKRKKKCKNCLPAIQIEGTGGPKSVSNKTAVAGFWSVPMADQFTDSIYDYQSVNKDGKVKVKKEGLYLVYAQMNFIGSSKRGFSILKGQPDGNDGIIGTFEENSITLSGTSKRGYHVMKIPPKTNSPQIMFTCALYTLRDEDNGNEACASMKIVKLEKNDVIFLQEISKNYGGVYSKSTSFFGLVRISNSSPTG